MLLVDADNAFNTLNRKTALLNIKSLCPTFHMFLNNLYKQPVTLFVANTTHTISSAEGSTQGCPAAMAKYALGTIPLIDLLHAECVDEGTKQGWYADDASATGTLKGIQHWWNLLNKHGPGYGYHPKPSKCILVVKNAADLLKNCLGILK